MSGGSLAPYRQEDTFEQWVTNRFGRRLFQTFFKTYTEKVWGIPCSEIHAEWAAQRIKDLSLRAVLLQKYRKPRRTIRTLIEEFRYPRLGPGMMWEAVRDKVESRGGVVRLKAAVVRVQRPARRVEAVVGSNGGREESCAVTSPLQRAAGRADLKLDPPSPPAVCRRPALKYRDFLTVCLIVNRADVFPDNWIYIHDPGVRVGRIQNFKNWSPSTWCPIPASRASGSSILHRGRRALEEPDEELIELGKREIERWAWSRRRRSRTAASSECRRPTRSMTPATRRALDRSGPSWRASTSSTPSAATACTDTITRITR